MIISQYNSNNSLTGSLIELRSKKEIIWMNSLTYQPRLKKDLWFKFRHFRAQDPDIVQDKHNLEFTIHNPRSTVFSNSANPFNLPQKSTIRVLLKAKSVRIRKPIHSLLQCCPSMLFMALQCFLGVR